jgi:hypothetical protein
MPRDSHRKATEFQQRSAHAHLAASEHGKQDHQTGHEQSRRALEHSARAFAASREAEQQSAKHSGEANASPGVTDAK